MNPGIWNFISGSAASLIAEVKSAVDEYFYTSEEQAADKKELEAQRAQFNLRMSDILKKLNESEYSFKLEMQKLLEDRERQIHETYRNEINSSREVIVAELQQSDKYTKRARPTVIYAGLIFILLEIFGTRIGILNYFNMDSALIDSSTAILESFLYMWGAIAGAYALGRSAEKRGITNTVTRLATGTKPVNAESLADDIQTRVRKQIQW